MKYLFLRSTLALAFLVGATAHAVETPKAAETPSTAQSINCNLAKGDRCPACCTNNCKDCSKCDPKNVKQEPVAG